jgi:hypothetical protein
VGGDHCNQLLEAYLPESRSAAVVGILSAEGIGNQLVARSIATGAESRMGFAPEVVGWSELMIWVVP